MADAGQVVVGLCPRCGRVESLFEAWNEDRAMMAVPPLATWKCPKCGLDVLLNVTVSSMPIDEFERLEAGSVEVSPSEPSGGDGLAAWLEAVDVEVRDGCFHIGDEVSVEEATRRFKAEVVGRLVQGFRIDLDAVESVEDLMLYWSRPSVRGDG